MNQIDTIFLWKKKAMIYGGNIRQKMRYPILKKKCGISFMANKNSCFLKRKKSTDNNVTIINDDIVEEVNKIKNKPGKDIWLYGGSSLITSFIRLGLVDEFRLSVHPVILGEGKPLFVDIKERLNLNLVNTKSFSSGVVQLCYHLNEG
ncbi:dihydrofolate reductase family protein [Peribacillus frigoritolerans]|nr:dihydrofolate reductase family protein [Peribacillus frigoritolerans]